MHPKGVFMTEASKPKKTVVSKKKPQSIKKNSLKKASGGMKIGQAKLCTICGSSPCCCG